MVLCRNLPTTSTILLSAMFESFLYPKWRYGPAAAAPLRSTHTTHKNLFLVLIPFFHDPQARPEMVLGSALEAAQSRAELGDDSSSSYIYILIYILILVASASSPKQASWKLLRPRRAEPKETGHYMDLKSSYLL